MRHRILLDMSLLALVLLTLGRLAIPGVRTRDYPALQLGDVLDIPAMTWGDAPRHVVLMISTTCVWCSKSADWYRVLSVELSHQRSVHLAVVHGEEGAAVARWLEERRIVPAEVVRVPKAKEIGLSETPTALIVDSTGRVTDAWIGAMTTAQQLAFRDRTLALPDAKPLTNIPEEVDRAAFLDMVARRADFQVIDIRDRVEGGLGKAASLTMPIDEVAVRAPIELARTRTVVVDCSPGWMQRCRVAARVISGYVPHALIARP